MARRFEPRLHTTERRTVIRSGSGCGEICKGVFDFRRLGKIDRVQGFRLSNVARNAPRIFVPSPGTETSM